MLPIFVEYILDNRTEHADHANGNCANNPANDTHSEHHRRVHTFVKRRVHMNAAAKIAMADTSFADIIVNHGHSQVDSIDNLSKLFANDNPIWLEIGFGMGDSLIQMASENPHTNFVGIEVHEPGIGRTAHIARQNALHNVKLINGDAIALLQQLPEASLDAILLFFPDPWQKKRHHKRRFVDPVRMPLVVRALKTGGIFHCATDWEDYAIQMLEVLSHTTGLSNQYTGYAPRGTRPFTKFEKRGQELGHGVWDLVFYKTK